MELKLGIINIRDVRFADRTEIKDDVLYVNKQELLKELKDDRFVSVDVDLAKPGDSTRILPVKDVIEPRVKVEGGGDIFPGLVSKVESVGYGITHVLKGVAVVTTGRIVGFQEGIIDMSGEGAKYSPFSQTLNICLVAQPKDELAPYEHEAALRIMGLKAAAYIAQAGCDIVPDNYETYSCPPLPQALKRYEGLPKVVYVYMLQSQGLMHDTYVYGIDAKGMLPTFISPTEVMDGAIVSGNCVSACDKNTTYHHQNNPVIHELFKHHGTDYNFLGVVITNENVTLADKQRSSDYTAKLVEWLGADAVIISEEGFGNPDADLMMNCTKLEKKGIKTVLITDEYAGRDGASQSLADADPLADAVVTAGNANEVIELPAMDKIIGHIYTADTIAGGFSGSLGRDGKIKVEIQAIIGSTNELGFSNLTAKGV